MSEEADLIHGFVVSSKRERLIELLASPKRRREALSTLAHFKHLDQRWVVPLPSNEHDPRAVGRALTLRGAPDTCYVVSEDRELDGQRLQLSNVLERIIGAGMGTLVSCVPGSLAFFEGEGPSDRCILARRAI